LKTKQVIPREQASRDANQAIDWYLTEGNEQAASRFIDTLEQAYTHIGKHPAIGSPHYAHELQLTGLRSWPLTRYPYLVFYLERDDHIDVWRVLHGKQDISAWLAAS
jgi:toxin ParE1/3/4